MLAGGGCEESRQSQATSLAGGLSDDERQLRARVSQIASDEFRQLRIVSSNARAMNIAGVSEADRLVGAWQAKKTADCER